jgi:hypothetical protein
MGETIRLSGCPHNHESLKRDDAAWSALELLGVMQVPAGEDGPAYALELRNCSCHSTLGREVVS